MIDEAKGEEKMRVEWKEESRHLPLIPGDIITAVIYCGHKERNKAIPTLLVSPLVFRRMIPVKKRWRERAKKGGTKREVTARQTAKKKKRTRG